MAQEDTVSIKIPEADLTEIKSALAILQEKLVPHLKVLSSQERLAVAPNGRQDDGKILGVREP